MYLNYNATTEDEIKQYFKVRFEELGIRVTNWLAYLNSYKES